MKRLLFMMYLSGSEIPVSLERSSLWEGRIGLWVPTVPEILLNGEMRGDALRTTFLHEVIHAVEDLCGIELDDHCRVDALASTVYAALRRNQGLVNWLSVGAAAPPGTVTLTGTVYKVRTSLEFMEPALRVVEASSPEIVISRDASPDVLRRAVLSTVMSMGVEALGGGVSSMIQAGVSVALLEILKTSPRAVDWLLERED